MFLESIRAQNGRLENLPRHEARTHRARWEVLGIRKPLRLRENLTVPPEAAHGVWKCRVGYGADGVDWVTWHPYQPQSLSEVYAVDADLVDYRHKWANRSAIDALAVGLPPGASVLMVKKGCITDLAYANIAFEKNGQWFTPETPLLEGVRRAILISKKIIHPIPIRLENLPEYRYFKPINALLRFAETPKYPITLIRF